MMKRPKLKHCADGKENILKYYPDEDYYSGPQTTLPEVSVVGDIWKQTQKPKGLYPTRYRYNPNNWVSARTKQLQTSEAMSPFSIVGDAVQTFENAYENLTGLRLPINEYVFPALSAGNWVVGKGNPYKGAEMRSQDERLLGAWLPLDFAGPKMAGNAIKGVADYVWTSKAPMAQYMRYPIGKLLYGLDAQFPTLYRKIKALPLEPQNGKVQVSNPNPRFAFQETGEVSEDHKVRVCGHLRSSARRKVLLGGGSVSRQNRFPCCRFVCQGQRRPDLQEVATGTLL